MSSIRNTALALVVILTVLLIFGCERYTHHYGGVGEKKDAPEYTVKADPNR